VIIPSGSTERIPETVTKASEWIESQSQEYLRSIGKRNGLEPADYSFVVKRRGTPQKPWRWEIYCAGKSAPVERSPVFFESMAEAAKEGKKALAHFLAKRAA
jgi:hypothetical protein